MNNMYIPRKMLRKLPGKVIKAVPMPEPELIEGYGCRGSIGSRCREAGYSCVLLLTDRVISSLGYVQAVEQSLSDEGINYRIYDGISSEPRLDYIEKGRELALEIGAQCIISLGGGSVLDTGKMIAAGCRLRHLPVGMLLQKFLIVPGKTLPVFAVPSTAGTGAEITVGAIITRNSGGKFAVVIDGLDVQKVFLDSELTVNAPWSITAACGIDALSHGLEGCLADVTSSDSDMHKSRECVRLVLENLPHLKDCPEDRAARSAMCLAANYGGNAINKQLAGYVHAFAHAIGSRYHIPHGEAIALVMVPVLRAELDGCFAQMSELARYCSYDGAGALLGAVEELIRVCGLGLGGAVVKPEDYRTLSVAIAKDSVNYSAPVTFGHSKIISILSEITGSATDVV